MKKNLLWLFAAAFLAAACVRAPLTKDYEKVARHFREDVLHFYETISDSYFILGYEYFELSREFEKKGNLEQAAYYSDKATLYYNLSKDMKNAAAETRRFAQDK